MAVRPQAALFLFTCHLENHSPRRDVNAKYSNDITLQCNHFEENGFTATFVGSAGTLTIDGNLFPGNGGPVYNCNLAPVTSSELPGTLDGGFTFLSCLSYRQYDG